MQSDDWSDYQAFLAIARAGQLARAGATLGVDATTMGRRLRRLEARLGLTLCEQTREGQVLTEAGEDLFARVEAMAAAAAGIGEAAHPGEGLTGTLRVSVSEGFGSAFLAPRLGELARRHPALKLDLVASSGFLSPSRHEADIAVMLSRPRTGPVVARKLSDYALQLYASTDYIAGHGAPAREADLVRGHRLVGYVPELIYAPELRYLDEIHPGLAATLRSPSIVVQARLIASGAGIGVLPCFMAEGDARLVPVLPARRILRSFWLVAHKDTRRLARVRAAADWLVDTVAANRAVLVPAAPIAGD